MHVIHCTLPIRAMKMRFADHDRGDDGGPGTGAARTGHTGMPGELQLA
jgi:hypothetical protein